MLSGVISVTRIVSIVFMTVVLSACALHRTQDAGSPNVQAVTQVIAAQDRVNRYLRREVIPHLMSCWSGIEGEGTITVRQGYTRTGDQWVAGETTIDSTNLATGQGERALRCFQSSLKGTSFAVEKDDSEAETYWVHWSLPVPWPKDIQEVALRMSTNPGGGGGCGGPEAPPPACWTCAYIQLFGFSFCAKSCAGYKECTKISNGCMLRPISPRCVTVSPFGNLGGIVPY